MALYTDRRVILSKIEVTEGTDPTPAAANARTYEEHSFTDLADASDRKAVSPEQAGYLPFATVLRGVETFTALVTMQTISAADATDAPHVGLDLQTTGWTLVSENSSDTHTYVLGSGQGSTQTIYSIRNNDAKTNSQRTIGLGGRGGGSLMAEAGQPWKVEGERFYQISGAPRAPQGSAYTTAISLDDEQPIVLESATVRIYDIAAAELYTSGDLASPGGDGDLHSFRLDFNRGQTHKRRARGAYGVLGGQLSPAQPTLNLVLDVNDYTRVNLHTARTNNAALEILIQCAQRGNSANTATLLCYGAITELTDEELADGVYTANLTLALLYPPDVSDNSPAPGISPTQVATTGTNRGLPVIPSGLVTGLAYLQFKTTT
jgi:hypothetical protein